MWPGVCRSKAHRREHLGYAGRRVLVSRKWSGKTLADHKADRLAYVLDLLGIDPDHPGPSGSSAPPGPVRSSGYAWELARPTDPDVKPREHRLLASLGQHLKRRQQLQQARQERADLSATGKAA